LNLDYADSNECVVLLCSCCLSPLRLRLRSIPSTTTGHIGDYQSKRFSISSALLKNLKQSDRIVILPVKRSDRIVIFPAWLRRAPYHPLNIGRLAVAGLPSSLAYHSQTGMARCHWAQSSLVCKVSPILSARWRELLELVLGRRSYCLKMEMEEMASVCARMTVCMFA
jgi:hypothetical protein